MPSKKRFDCFVLQMVFMFCAVANSYGTVGGTLNWRDFGNQTLYFLASDRAPLPNLLRRQKQLKDAFAKPDSLKGIRTTELFLEEALKGYGQDSLAWHGRITLNINPHCILGLYLADKFAETKLGDAGKRIFEQSVKHSCIVAFGVPASWQELLEAELIKTNKNSTGDFRAKRFGKAEMPFLLIYLMENGSHEAVRQKARKWLAHYLEKQYGLEPALRQYHLLLEQKDADVDEPTKLKIARQLEQTGALGDVQQLYEKIFEDTNSPQIAVIAAQNLAEIRLAKSKEAKAWQTLMIFHERFPEVELTSKRLRRFFVSFKTERQKQIEQLIGKLQTVQKEDEAFKLCQQFNKLLIKEEVLNQWKNLVANVEPESLAWQCSQLYIAQNLADTGKANDAEDILNSLFNSGYSAIRAGALMVLGNIAQKDGRTFDAVTLYQQAAKMKRPSTLPQWIKTIQVKPMELEKLTPQQLDFFALLLRGYNELSFGCFQAATTNLLRAKGISKSLQETIPYGANKEILRMLMLSCLKMNDCAKAEQYGLEALKSLCKDENDAEQLSTFLSRVEKVDNLLFVLFSELRSLAGQDKKSQLVHYVGNVYFALKTHNLLKTESETDKTSFLNEFWQIKRQHVVKLLSAEYNLAKTQPAKSDDFEEFLYLEPVIFTIQLLDKDSFEEIHSSLAAVTEPQYAKGQIYRFAKFSQQVNLHDMALTALNAAYQQIDSTDEDSELLKNIAEMYLLETNHQRAIEIYERIVGQSSDPNEAQEAYLKIIEIYAKLLKSYNTAITKCRQFLEMFPDSQLVNQVEFLVGKFAYITEDYVGATRQLDDFIKRHPDSPQRCEAMMLAALSLMSDGNTQDAIDRFEEIIQKYPGEDLAARSKFLIGYAYVSEQNYSKALEIFKQLLEQFPMSKYTEQTRSFIDRLNKVSE